MPRPSGKKSVPGVAATPCSTDRCASSTASAPGSVSPEENPPCGVVQRADFGIDRFSAIEHPLPLAPVKLA